MVTGLRLRPGVAGVAVAVAVAVVIAAAVGTPLAQAAPAGPGTPAGVPAAALGRPQVIGAPHYGDTLFNFYQDKTFDALVGLMVSQHFKRVAPHDAEADVLRGGMLLAFGMHRDAGDVFTRVINSSTAPAVRDRAWYFLARAKQQRGLLDEAQDALSRIEAPLQGTAFGASLSTNAGSLEDSHQLMRAQLMLAREDYAGAAAVLDKLKDSGNVGLIAQFNLGVAMIKNGDVEQGQTWLDAVGRMPAADEEQRSVRDRANLALGFAALQAKQPREARASLQRVRLQGLEANRALLAFGWAAMELNDPQLALVPWQELAARPDVDAAVLEARLAVPYALSEIGATQLALDSYAQAADGFAQEQRALDASIAAIRAGNLVQDLVALNPSTGLAGITQLQALPSMPQVAHLAPLLAGNDFQQAYKNLRDLQFLKSNLVQWQDNLGVFSQMLDNRRQAFAQRLPAVRQRASGNAAASGDATTGLQGRRDALADDVAQAMARDDVLAFADPREAALAQRLQRAQARVARIGNEAEIGDAADRLRLLSGALQWQLTQAWPQRRWQAVKGLRDTDQALAQTRERDTKLLAAQRDEPGRQQAMDSRIGELTQRLSTLLQALDQMSQANARQLQAIAVTELQAQQGRLVVYEGQARLASAQILDQALFSRPPDTAEPADKPPKP
jgi:hypothetical protein